jgi:hypothetical protein
MDTSDPKGGEARRREGGREGGGTTYIVNPYALAGEDGKHKEEGQDEELHVMPALEDAVLTHGCCCCR